MRMIFGEFVGGRGAVGLLFLRLVAGTAFVLHGWHLIQHPFNWMPPNSPIPGFLQALAALSEFGGGLAWILGLLTPLASAGLLCTMAVAVQFHVSQGQPFVAGKPGAGSYELALGYFAVALLLILMGPGVFAADYCLFGKRKKRDDRTETGK